MSRGCFEQKPALSESRPRYKAVVALVNSWGERESKIALGLTPGFSAPMRPAYVWCVTAQLRREPPDS